MSDTSYSYDINYCHNVRQLGKLVNVLKNQKPVDSLPSKPNLSHFDLYDSCFDENGFLDADKVAKKQYELSEDDTYPDFPYHVVMLCGQAGSGKSTAVQFLNTYLGFGLYCSYTNKGTDNINSKLLNEQSQPFGTLMANMNMQKGFLNFEQQGMTKTPQSFKEAQLMSLAYDWYNVSSMMSKIKSLLPAYVPFKGDREEESIFLWMLSSMFRRKDRSNIPQIAISDFILLDESGMCPYEKLNSLAFLIHMVRCYFQIKMDKVPVFILVGSTSQTHATKGIPHDKHTGLKRIVSTPSVMDYVLKNPIVAKYTGIKESGRMLVFIKNKRCNMKFLIPLLSALDLGKNIRSHAHLLDSIVLPREALTNPSIEKTDGGINTSLATSERLSTVDIDLSDYVRIAVRHNILSEYRKECYKVLPCIKFPCYVVVLFNEIRRMAKCKDPLAFLDYWINDTANDLGSYSQFRETLGAEFERASDILRLEDVYWPPISMGKSRPCPFKDTCSREDLSACKSISTQENIELVLYRSHTNLLTGKPSVCQTKSVFFVTGFHGRFSKFMDCIHNTPSIFSAPTFAVHILKAAILYLEQFQQKLGSMNLDDEIDDNTLEAMTRIQDHYSVIMYLDINQASNDQLCLAISNAMRVLCSLYKDVKSSFSGIDDELVYFYTKDIWKNGTNIVHFLTGKDIMYSRLGIGEQLKFIDVVDFPEQLQARVGISSFIGNKYFPGVIKKCVMVVNDKGFLGLIPPFENVHEIFSTKEKCTFKPIGTMVSPITDELAMTVTRSQGLTIPKVVGLMDESISMENLYVMLSRAQEDLVISKNVLLNEKFRYKPNKFMYRILRSKETRLIL